jgi:hypothetical protein
MTDFETHPSGTAAELAALRAQVAALTAERDNRRQKLIDVTQELADKSQDLLDYIAALEPAPDIEAPAENAIARGETDNQMLARLGTNGAAWAAEFRTRALTLGYSDMDEGWLIGWFCNAIEAAKPSLVSDEALIRAALEAAARVADLQKYFCAEWSHRRNAAPTAVDELAEVACTIRALATPEVIATIRERAKG